MLNISENTLIKILKYGVYFSLLWFFLVVKYTLYPSHTGKVLFLLSLIEILSVFYILLIAKYPQYRPKFNLMTGAIVVWGGTMVLSAIFGTDLWISIFSQFKRMTGLFFLAHIFVFFLIITTIFKIWKDWRNFFIANVAVGSIQAFFALYQVIDPNFFNYYSDPIGRVFGLFGNPSFLSSYLVFALFFSVFLFLKLENIKWKIFNTVSFFIMLAAIFFAATRGIILGVFVGLIIFIIIKAIFSQNKKIRIGLVSVFVIMIALSLFIWANKDKHWVSAVPGIQRITSTTWSEFMVSTRKMLWESAWGGFKDRPILGWGPENFNLVFDKHYNPKILDYGTGESWPTKPHNVFMEQLTGGGIVGLMSFIFLYGAAIYIIWRKINKGQSDDLPLAAFIAILSAHLIQNIVLFDTFYTYYMLAIVFGFFAFLDDDRKQIFSIKPLKKDYANFVAMLSIAIAIFLVYMNIGTYRAAYYTNNFKPQFLNINSWYRDDFIKSYIKFYLDQVFKFKNKEEEYKMLEAMNEEIDGILKRHPLNVFDRGFKVQVLTELGTEEPKYLDEAEELLKDTLKLSPDRPQLHLLLGRINFLRKDYDSAERDFRKAVELHTEDGAAHWYLGISLYANKKIEDGLKEFNIAHEMGYETENPAQLGFWALVYAENGDFAKARDLYRAALNYDTDNFEYMTKLAIVFKELGEKENAIITARNAVKLNPNLKEEAELFIREVEEMPDSK